MNSPETPVSATPLSAFAPLPLRPRGPMEVLDVGVRVYKQYFWTLVSWSALVSFLAAMLQFVPFMSMLSMFLEPLATGACVCCIAAAVRGQGLSFKQCGDFSKSRYGPMLGMYFLSILILIGVMILSAIVIGLGVAGGMAVRDSTLGLVSMIILGIVGGIGFVFLASCMTIWMTFVQIVVCMEEDKRGTPALRRAYDLLKGHWIRVSVLITLLGLGCLVLLAILCAAGAMLMGVNALKELAAGNVAGGSFWGVLVVWTISVMLITTLWKPLYYVTLCLFYLDLRIRKEALDLEWTAHQTTPAEALAHGHQGPGVWGPDAPGAGGFVATPGATPPASEWYNAVPAGQTPPVPNLHGAAAAAIAPRMICSHCGASVPAAETCSNCGALLPGTPATQANATTQADWSASAAPSQPGAVNATTPAQWTGAAPAAPPAHDASPPSAPTVVLPPADEAGASSPAPQNWNDPSTPQP